MHTYIHTYVRTYVHTYIHTHILSYIHTYIHTYVHTYIHTYIHSECSGIAVTFQLNTPDPPEPRTRLDRTGHPKTCHGSLSHPQPQMVIIRNCKWPLLFTSLPVPFPQHYQSTNGYAAYERLLIIRELIIIYLFRTQGHAFIFISVYIHQHLTRRRKKRNVHTDMVGKREDKTT